MPNLHHEMTFLRDDFDALDRQVVEQKAGTDSLDFWQQSWKKLKANPRAMLSLFFIASLILFSMLGPFLWTVNPARQDLSQLSQAPALHKKAIVVNSFEVWSGNPSMLKKNEAFEILKPAHTESVKLLWRPQTGALHYEIYRHEYRPTGINDLGLPIADTQNTFFEDKLNLEARDYYYSVLAFDNNNVPINFVTKRTSLTIAVPSQEAEKNIADGSWKAITEKQDGFAMVELPSHPMGTDYLGRDMMARLMLGGRTSLVIALLASLLFVAMGTVYGAFSAYSGGRLDNVLMRFADFVIALPFLLFMILLKVSFGIKPGESGIWVMVFSLVILSWPSTARLIRGQVLVLREQNFILAARINGAKVSYIMWRHLFPNVLSLILISLSFAIPSVILTEAFLSFIGLGVVPPTPSWGSMCQEGIKTLLFHPHELIFPASFIGITVLAFNLLGDGLRDAFDVNSE